MIFEENKEDSLKNMNNFQKHIENSQKCLLNKEN